MAAALDWHFKSFAALGVHELYALLRLRTEVFVVEQNCVFQDMDGADEQAMHLLGFQDAKLTAYTRFFNAGLKFKEASIGRVITHASALRKVLRAARLRNCQRALRRRRHPAC
jgi:ElaA protein